MNLTEHSTPGSVLGQALNNSCDHCRVRKIKCDSGKPRCSYCEKKGIPCTYSINKKKQIFSGTPLSLSLTELEDRIRNLENLSNEILHRQEVITSSQQGLTTSLTSSIPLDLNSNLNTGLMNGYDNSSQSNLYSDTFNLLSQDLPTNFNTITSAATPSFNNNFDINNTNYMNQALTGYQYLPNSYIGDPLSVTELRRFLLSSYKSKAEFKGFANHHKQVLIQLCLTSDLVMSAFCAVSCAHASFPFLDSTLTTRRRLVDHFLNQAKSLLIQSGYANPSIHAIQALILISIVEYEKGNFSRSIMYVQSALSMACVLGIHKIDENRIGTITSENAFGRKIWWELFTMDRCSPFMLYEESNLINVNFPVMLADSLGHSLGFTLDQLQVSHIESFLMDSDPSWRLLPAIRLKMSDLLQRAHVLAVKVSKCKTFEERQQYQASLYELQHDLSKWSRFASPNPFLNTPLPNSLVGGTGLPSAPGDHPSTQASFVLLFNCAYILAYCPTLYWSTSRVNQEGSQSIPDSCGVAAGYLIRGIDLSRPSDPRGERWHQVLPFFSYIGCLAYHRLFMAYPGNLKARSTALSQFELLYLELAQAIRHFPVSDLFMANLRSFRSEMQMGSPEDDGVENRLATLSIRDHSPLS